MKSPDDREKFQAQVRATPTSTNRCDHAPPTLTVGFRPAELTVVSLLYKDRSSISKEAQPPERKGL